MSEKTGRIGWVDLTVHDAENVRDFYAQVFGWEPKEFDTDYNMHIKDAEEPVAGICHKRGPNADIPSQWLIYVTVENLDASMEKVEALGGEIIKVQKMQDGGGIAIIQDPAGAVCALWQEA